MSYTAEGLTILTFLVPGFIASGLFSAIAVRKERDNLARVAEALIFSLLIYAGGALFTGETPVELRYSPIGDGTVLSIHYNPSAVWVVVALAIGLALLMGFLARTGIHMKLLRRLKITSLTGYDSIWLGVFMLEPRYVIVNMRDGRRIFGWPMYRSNTVEEGLLYLYGPAWIDQNQQYIDLGVHGILISRQDIASIEFTTVSKANAREATTAEVANER